MRRQRTSSTDLIFYIAVFMSTFGLAVVFGSLFRKLWTVIVLPQVAMLLAELTCLSVLGWYWSRFTEWCYNRWLGVTCWVPVEVVNPFAKDKSAA